MKYLVVLIGLLLTLSAGAQPTNTPPTPPSGIDTLTNAPTPPSIVGGVEQILGVFGGSVPTNITAGPFATCDTHGKNWAWGFAADYNLNNNIAMGLAVDSIPTKFTLFTGQIVFKLPFYPLAWTGWGWATNWFVEPFVFSELGAPLSNASSGNTGSSPVLVVGSGANIPIISFNLFSKPAQFSIAGWYENLTGAGDYSGNRIGLCPNLSWRF